VVGLGKPPYTCPRIALANARGNLNWAAENRAFEAVGLLDALTLVKRRLVTLSNVIDAESADTPHLRGCG
jgi:hypothetical protein